MQDTNHFDAVLYRQIKNNLHSDGKAAKAAQQLVTPGSKAVKSRKQLQPVVQALDERTRRGGIVAANIFGNLLEICCAAGERMIEGINPPCAVR